jgi:hypothetical protein
MQFFYNMPGQVEVVHENQTKWCTEAKQGEKMELKPHSDIVAT